MAANALSTVWATFERTVSSLVFLSNFSILETHGMQRKGWETFIKLKSQHERENSLG
jgi:hypothetical protein